MNVGVDMVQYKMIAENMESTILAEYESQEVERIKYQSEIELENEFVKQLKKQAYDYLEIRSEKELVDNLRRQLEKLNNYVFEDDEWKDFYNIYINNSTDDIKDKTNTIQNDYIKLLKKKDGTIKNIYLLDKNNIHNNTLQVASQYKENMQANALYDVVVLVNGLPLVYVELKKRSIDIKEAFNQITGNNQNSLLTKSKLFEYIQIFVISNGINTRYYSNTTRSNRIMEVLNDEQNGKNSSNSFEFTSYWADARNQNIANLIDFAKTFFAKHSLLNILTKYCVFTSDKKLLVMRPYQIVATEKILNKIKISTNYKTYGGVEGGGYIWHTTGSGKTLTSFKTAQLATKMDGIEKVLFVVDRKDLDYQTMKEYDKFEKGAANSNTSTHILKKQLEDPDVKIIITTIQKLTCFVKKYKQHPVYDKHLVMIFDECHRSQFGEQHKIITKAFNKYHLFGFTGTPIFLENAYNGENGVKTTEQIFGEKLHTYTIINAITDKNVLPFKVDYVATIKEVENVNDEEEEDYDKEMILKSKSRIERIVEYILDHFNQKTKRNDKSYEFSVLKNVKEMVKSTNIKGLDEIKEKIRLTGFNSIFAVSSIEYAQLYYAEFKKQMKIFPEKQLKIAIIYSYTNLTGKELNEEFDDENPENTEALDQGSKKFLEDAIKDYNKMFGTNYDTSSDKFQNYYKDVSLRMKNREIDLLIVVNMFLTGFDATTLNTLWVDKNLKMQGLLQAYSRTNRILNSIKTFGNIVCFRDLEEATNKSLALFGDKNARGLVILKSFEEYYEKGYKDENGKQNESYVSLIKELSSNFPAGEKIEDVRQQKEFIILYGKVLQLKNILDSFDEFSEKEILTEREWQEYNALYIDLYEEWKKKYNELKKEKEADNSINIDISDLNISLQSSPDVNIYDEVIFQIELIKQVEMNIDYILNLIKKYKNDNQDNTELMTGIEKSIDSSMELRNKKDLILSFVNTISPQSNVDNDWKNYIQEQKSIELNKIIEEEHLKKEETYNLVNDIFESGFIQTNGTDINKILPSISLFSNDNARLKKRENVLEKLAVFFDRFKDIVGVTTNE